jgi:hypothetical protein
VSRGARAWLIGLVAGLLAAAVAVTVAVHLRPGDEPTRHPAGDRVRAAAQALERDHFYAAPEVREQFTDSQYDAIVRAAKAAPTPVYVVFWADYGYDAGYLGDLEACDQLMALIGHKGYYAVVTQAGYGAQVDALGYEVPSVDDALAQGRPSAAMLRFVKALGDAPRERPYSDSESDYWGGPGGGIAAGALMAVGGFFTLMLLVWLASLLRRRAA